MERWYHAVNVALLVFAVDGGEEGLLVEAAFQSLVEVPDIRVVVAADVVVLPPAGDTATFRS